MKTSKNFNFLTLAMVAMLSTSIFSCSSEESDPQPVVVEEPTPTTPEPTTPEPTTPSDLEKVQAGILGVKIRTVEAWIVKDNGDTTKVLAEDLCTSNANLANSVEDYTFTFTSSTIVNAKNHCNGANFDLAYIVTMTDNVVNIKINSTSANTVVDAYFNTNEMFDVDGKVLARIKGILKESSSNWSKNPITFFEKQ